MTVFVEVVARCLDCGWEFGDEHWADAEAAGEYHEQECEGKQG